jgi:hypothetical protein
MKYNWFYRMSGLSWRQLKAPAETAFMLSTDRDGHPCPFWSCLIR